MAATTMMLSFGTIAMAFLALISRDHSQIDPVATITPSEISDSYDFVIVGAGSAGSALAARLTELPGWRVLLLEAGHQETLFSRTPAMCPVLQGSIFDWNYTTVPQRDACLAYGGRCRFPRGKVLGGSSGINFMIYTPGYRSDYDRWAETGNCGWSYDEVHPYFIQSEGNRVPGVVGHGRSGPLTVSLAPYHTPLSQALIRGGVSLGLRYADCPQYEGGCVYNVMSTIRAGRRCSASTAYLEPTSGMRDNLNIVTGALAHRVIIENGVATGVEFELNGQVRTVRATREVILSAGAVNSPKLLMQSGIGPREHLESVGIPVVLDLPGVGGNLQDHVRVPLSYVVNNGIASTLADLANPQNANEYLLNQTGPYSYSGVDALAWVNVGDTTQNPENQAPNIQYHFFTRSARGNANQATAATTVVRPYSTGTVRLASSDPREMPLIDVNYYADRRDFITALEGVAYSYALLQTPPLQAVGARLDYDMQPICRPYRANLTEYFTCLIREYTQTMYHPVGTAKMGSLDDQGVVNYHLQVHGIQQLRVIDASVAPTLISMNTNAMSVMIGERGSDMIKAAHGQPTHQPVRRCNPNEINRNTIPVFQ